MSQEESGPTAWIFQYHPSEYNLRDHVREEGVNDHWPAVQNRRLMRKGELVYILRAGGPSGGAAAQIEAVGPLSSDVYFDDNFVRDPYKIWVHYEYWVDPPLTRPEMSEDEILRGHHILAVGRTGTNFRLPQGVSARLMRAVAGRLRPIISESTSAQSDNKLRKTRLGTDYRPANAASLVGSERIRVLVDPELTAEALRIHGKLQNQLAAYIRRCGYEPLSPHPGGAQYDLAWTQHDITWVAEIKSLRPENEETQLRLGLAQVQMYRYVLAQQAGDVKAVLFVQYQPNNPAWQGLCDALDIVLSWPEDLEQQVCLGSTKGQEALIGNSPARSEV